MWAATRHRLARDQVQRRPAHRMVGAIEQLVASVRKRVEAGADAPYEAALVEGEMLRSRSESDGARAALGEAWAALCALAHLPAEPRALASPGMPEPRVGKASM